jgi:cyanoexosortase B-associated protein
LAIASFITLPNYFTGNWSWVKELEASNIQQLRHLQQKGITLPGWQTLEQRVLQMGGHKWSVQIVAPAALADQPTPEDSAILMLRPQTWRRDLPQVDWVDIDGARQWTADSHQTLRFAIAPHTPAACVTARFFRGWDQQQTYAVLQWYAWADAGHPAPSQWFWADRLTRLRNHQSMPWVAVSLLIPINPLGEITAVQPRAETLGKLIQSTLMQQGLSLN